jgi:hypothetical protein
MWKSIMGRDVVVRLDPLHFMMRITKTLAPMHAEAPRFRAAYRGAMFLLHLPDVVLVCIASSSSSVIQSAAKLAVCQHGIYLQGD